MATRRSRLNGTAFAALPTGAAAATATALGLLAALPPTPAQAQASGATLKVLSPAANAASGGAFSLDVAFQSRSGSPVTVAELWVDGVRWVHRPLDTPQTKNVLSFAVDASTLAPGSHNVVVKVFCANGASSQTNLQIDAGDNDNAAEVAPGAPDMAFQMPGVGKDHHVQGSVEIALDAPAKNGVNPYITIYVDKQFKTLKNYPPYSYTWDTTGVANGYHTVEATGYLDSTAVSTTRRLKLFVDNPGGNTNIQKEIPDLSATPPSAVSGTSLLHKATAARAGKKIPAVKHLASTTAPVAEVYGEPTGEPVVSAAGIASSAVEVQSLGFAPVAATASPSAEKASRLSLVAPPAAAKTSDAVVKAIPAVAHLSRRATAAAHARHMAVAALHPAVPVATAVVTEVPVASSAAEQVASAPLATIAAPTLAIKPTSASSLVAPQASVVLPAAKMTALTAPVQHHASHGLRGHGLRRHSVTPVFPKFAGSAVVASPRNAPVSVAGSHRAVVKPNALGMMNVADKASFQVAFDGQRIAFDVPPRVEAGLPIAPFRQIFEHTGGQVEWHPQGQVVRAINADREIVITVGSAAAQVNGQTFTMQRPAFVERGRTIVPLSFVGDALNVNVKYDPSSGHLEITSK